MKDATIKHYHEGNMNSQTYYPKRLSRTNTKLPAMKMVQKDTFLKSIVRGSWIILIIASLLQSVIFPKTENIFAVGVVLLAWAITTRIYLKMEVFKNFPLSSFLIIGFTATQFYLPLLFTSLEWKPVTFNMDLPYQVFYHSFAALIVLIISNAFYRSVFKNLSRRKNSILVKLKMFDAPTDLQLWLMGMLGIAASLYIYFMMPDIGKEIKGAASDKFIQGLVPFAYAPYFIPFGKMYGNVKPHSKKLVVMLVCFTVVLLIISMGRNNRTAFMVGFTSVGFAYILGLMLGMFNQRIFTLKNVAMAGAGLWLITGPLADLGTAMVNVRGQRYDMSASELVSRTLEAYGDKKAIEQRRKEDNELEDEWDERYLNNVITARFANLKFNDASLVQAEKTGTYEPKMKKFSTDYIWATLPQPFLDALKIDVDKTMIRGVSFGDYLYYRAGGPTEALGGYRTGHFAGTGMAAFGWWYLLILGVGIFPVFILFDKLFLNRRVLVDKAKSVTTSRVTFSLCGMLALDSIFRFLPTESVIGVFVFLLRDWIQLVILYLIVFHITRLAVRLLSMQNAKCKMKN